MDEQTKPKIRPRFDGAAPWGASEPAWVAASHWDDKHKHPGSYGTPRPIVLRERRDG